MLDLSPNETVLLVIRRHWYVFAGSAAVFIILLVIPPVILALIPVIFPMPDSTAFKPVVNFFLALYLAGLLAYILVKWLDYYLDVWIITDQRIIDVEQRGLFHREISEIALDRVQNVTVEIPGFMATLLKFGNIKIRTAGQGEFTIFQAPDFERAKDLILRYSQQQLVTNYR